MIEKVCSCKEPAEFDFVFLHGLTGDAHETWVCSDASGKQFWPLWLCEDFPRTAVYTLGYPASIFNKWTKQELNLHERAESILENLATHGIGERPLAFVAHSLGGLLVKEVLRVANECQDDGWKSVCQNTKLVCFLGTPHTGAALANVATTLIPHFLSTHIKTLSNNTGYLTALNKAYREIVDQNGISTVAYYEKHKTKSVALVVSAESADPGVGGKCRPMPVEADHINICKLKSRDELVYQSLRRHVTPLVVAASEPTPPPSEPATAEHIDELSSALQTVWDELGRLVDRQTRLPVLTGRLLEYSDINESSQAERLRAVGSAITWHRLLSGDYMPRPRALSMLTGAIEQWKTTIEETLSDDLAPVFWIDGLSGDGKSVLLLQAAHLILSQAQESVIFQAHSPDTIGNLLQHALDVVEPGTLVLVIVDDLHSTSDANALGKIISTFVSNRRLRFALLACGPTPERRAFERVVRDIRVTSFECPKLTPDERTAFSGWFGTAQPELKASHEELLVELLFEIKAGEPIPAFARSFGERLRKRELFEVVTTALAPNVFDSLAPIGLVEGARARAALEELARSDQLHFEVRNEPEVEGFRLVHSRIAWRLFSEWSKGSYLEAATLPFLAEYLGKALHFVPEGAYTYFVRLMGSISARLPNLLGKATSSDDAELEHGHATPSQLHRRLRKKFRAKGEDGDHAMLVEFTGELLQHLGTAPSARCYVARFALLGVTTLSAHADLLVQMAIVARDDARAHPAARMNVAAALVRAQWIQATQRSAQIEALKAMLDDPSVREYGSSGLMALLALPGGAESAVRPAIAWLDEVDDAMGAQQLLARLLVMTRGREDVVKAALRWLRKVGADTRTSSVISTLITTTRGREDVVAYALEWIAKVGAEPRAQQVVAALLSSTKGRSDVVAAALGWLDLAGTIAGTEDVIRAVISGTNGRDDVVLRALSWLEKVGTRPGSQHVLSALLTNAAERQDVMEATIAWLDKSGNRPGTEDVIRPLVSVMGDDEEVVLRALAWVDAVGTRPGSQHVVSALLAKTNGRQDTTVTALAWLRKIGTGAGSEDVIRSLIRVTNGRDDVVDLALTWLGEVGTKGGSEHVLSALLSNTDGRSDIVEAAFKWLDAASVRPGSEHVVSALLANAGSRAGVIEAAVKWLDAAGARPSAEHVLSPLLAAAGDRAEVVAYALAWLESTRESPTRVLRSLARYAAQHSEVIARVERFLEMGGRTEQRIQVLTALLHGSGASGAGIKLLIEAKSSIDRGARPKSDRIVYSIAASNALTQVLQACIDRPSDAKDLYFLISCAPPERSQAPLGEALLASKTNWPSGSERYLWRPVILDRRVDPSLYWGELKRWLSSQMPADRAGIVRSIASRTDLDRVLLESLSSDVQAEVRQARDRTSRNAAS